MKDRVRILVRSGKGGDGCVSFRREKFIPRGGPDGGDGGRGGHVIVRAKEKIPTLEQIKNQSIIRAGVGQPGGGQRMSGRHGADETIDVPPGTSVYDADTGTLLAELIEPGDKIMVAEGGPGGRGNIHFATPTNRVPRESEPGEPGIEREIELVYAIPADVAVVGLPGAGKSALVSALTRSRTKVDDYLFTTRSIHLGVVRMSPYQAYKVVDMPALVSGSAEGRGIGNNFLIHLERVRVIVFLLDPFEPEEAGIVDQWKILADEIAAFEETYLEKKAVAVINKWDVAKGELSVEMEELAGLPGVERVFQVSAETGEGLEELSNYIMRFLEEG